MTTMSDWVLTYQGKVRDVYIPLGESSGAASVVLMVASNRVSALDVILSPEIPGKGKVLTEVSGVVDGAVSRHSKPPGQRLSS